VNFKGGYSIKRMEDRCESIRLPVEALVQYVSKVAKKTKKARKR